MASARKEKGMKRSLKLAMGSLRNLLSALICIVMAAAIAVPGVFAEHTNSNETWYAPTQGYSVTQTAAGSRFPDVSPTHWALKHIEKLSLLGIIEGDDLGQYKPEDPVTQEQVVTMAIRMMGLEEAALNSSAAVVLPFAVQDYAKPYVAMAIDHKLINIQEEIADSRGATSQAWGSRSASREWVAKMVIRAIGKQEDALGLMDMPSIFQDNGKIAPSSVGYINMAVTLGIVNGFEDGTFRPDGTVTRAQMATFLSRAEKFLGRPSPRSVSGYVINLGNQSISIRDKAGKVQEYTLVGNTKYFGKDDRRIALSDIHPAYEVYLIQQNGLVSFVEVVNDEVPLEKIEGKLLGIDIDALTVTLAVGDSEATYKVDAGAAVVNQEGAGLSFSSLEEGSTVEISRNKLINNAPVSRIVVKRVPVKETAEVIFRSLNGSNLEVAGKTSGAATTYTLADDAAIYRDGNEVDRTVLYAGDQLKLHIVDDIVKSVEITVKAVDYVERGKLVSIDEAQKLLTIEKEDGKYTTAKYADLMNVVIEGSPLSSLKDLVIGDHVILEIKDNKIIRTKVTNRSIQANFLATIVNYDAENKLLTVKDQFGKPAVFVLGTQTNIEYDGTSIPLASFGQYFTKDKRVEMTLSQENVRSIKLANKFEGKVTGKSASELTIQTPNNGFLSFRMPYSPMVEIAGKQSATINDVRVGDQVKIVMSYNQDAIGVVSVKNTMFLKTKEKGSNNTLTFEDETGSTYAFAIGANVSIVREGMSDLKFADIGLGEYVAVDFTGFTVDKITILPVFYGKVGTVDATGGKLSIVQFNNTVTALQMGSSTRVVIGSNTYTNLNNVKPGDRVEAVRTIDGNYILTVLPFQVRTFSAYDPLTHEIEFLRRTLDDPIRYRFHPNAYVHRGEETITPNFLIKGDKVTVYFLGDKIIELVK